MRFRTLRLYNDNYGKPGSRSDSQPEIHLVNYLSKNRGGSRHTRVVR